MTSSELPSFESIRDSNHVVLSSMDMLRLQWKPFGPFSTCIQVVDDVDTSSGQQPYRINTQSFHPISTLAVTEPPVSSITVRQDDLEQWEADWAELHVPHADDHPDGTAWAAEMQEDNEEGHWEHTGGDDGEGRKLMRCCNEDRPNATPPLVVRASTQPFVTIHDFVTTVHPWLQTVRDDILSAKGVTQGGPLPVETPLYVHPLGLDRLRLVEGRNQLPDFMHTWQGVAEHGRRRVDVTLVG